MNENGRIVSYLSLWKEELAKKTDFVTIEEKANQIGLINSIDIAIARLKLCEKYDINPGAWFCVFPEQVHGYEQPGFRVVCDNETHHPSDWSELQFEGRGSVLFRAGDIAIKK
jgi:hypothetical protein